MLVSNRYLEEPDSVYKIAEDYLDGLIKMNSQLNIWEHKDNPTEKWLIKFGPGFKKLFKEFNKLVNKIKKKLSDRY